MPLVTFNDILPAARASRSAIGAFNVANYETACAVIVAAEKEKSPVIIQVYQRLLGDPCFPALAAMLRKLAELSAVPTVIHLDHGASLDQIKKAIDCGFSSVMMDGSKLTLQENIAITSYAATFAHKAGISIEGEIGHVPANGEPTPYAKPDDAVRFAQETGVDALAVAIGTAHGFYKSTPVINIDIAAEIGHRVSVPMVLHGGSGTPPEKVKAAIQCGFAKVNVATEFQYLFEQNLRAKLNDTKDAFVPVDLLMKPIMDQSVEYLSRMIRFFKNTSNGL